MNDIEELEKNIDKFKKNMNGIDSLKNKLEISNTLFQTNLKHSENIESKINEIIKNINTLKLVNAIFLIINFIIMFILLIITIK